LVNRGLVELVIRVDLEIVSVHSPAWIFP
jgi:hypothetical protein